MNNASNIAHARRHLVLCVADTSRMREEIARNLAFENYAVIEASNCREAISLLEVQRPDLILCDISRSSMEGLELLRYARERRSDLDDVPFLFLTDQTERQYLRDRAVDADCYLNKPIDADRLISAVRTQIAQIERIRGMVHRRSEDDAEGLIRSTTQSQSLLENIGSMFDCLSRGYIVLDSKGRVQSMNRTAKVITGSNDGLILVNEQIGARDQRARSRLSRLIQAVLDRTESSGAMTIPRERARPLVLQIFALESTGHHGAPGVAILVQDPETRPSIDQCIVAQMYRLTRTETKLALAMVDGMRMDQIASSFGVSQSTVAFHLKNLFRKTGTCRQADLIALLIQSAATYQPSTPPRNREAPSRVRRELMYA